MRWTPIKKVGDDMLLLSAAVCPDDLRNLAYGLKVASSRLKRSADRGNDSLRPAIALLDQMAAIAAAADRS
jgi:hypothetical protein